MILVVLWSLAVYGATAAAFLFLAHRYVVRLRRLPALLLAVAPFLLSGKALLTGGVLAPLDIVYRSAPFERAAAEHGIGRVANPLLVDLVAQMLPWRAAVREEVFAGRLPLWNPYVLGGAPLLGVQQPAVMHPGTWLGFLLPLPQAWTFDLTLRLFLALLCAYVFFRGSGSSETASLLGAAAWGFSDFLVFFLGYPVMPSVAPFPLLLLGLRRIAQVGDRRSVALTVSALVLVTVAGHPETLLFGVAGAGLFFLFELFVRGEPAGMTRPRTSRAIGLSLLAGLIALGLTAVVLLPFVEILPQTWHHMIRKASYATATRSEPLLESLRRVMVDLVPHAYGVLGKSEVVPQFGVPAGYVGTLLLPFVCAGLGARTPRRWLWAGLGLFGLAMHARLRGLIELVVALPLFDIAICDYFIFLWVFAAAALAVLGADRLREGHGQRPFVAGIVGAALAPLLVTAFRAEGLQGLGLSAGNLRTLLLLQIVPLLLALALVFRCARRRRWGTAPIALLLALFAAQRTLEEADVYPAYAASAFYPKLPVLEALPRGVPERMTALFYEFTPNVSAIYGVEDVRGYDAMLFAPYEQTFSLWCQQLPIYFNRVTDPRTPFLSFLNVRRVIVPFASAVPAGWKVLSEGNDVRVLENPSALPRAFVPRNVLWTEPEKAATLLPLIPDYAHDGIAAGSQRSGWQLDNRGTVETLAYTGQSLRVAVAAEGPGDAFVGTSIPDWPGWKLSIDGRRAPTYRFNAAFVGFPIPAGHHEAELVYRPDGFVWGAAISLTTAILCAASLARRRPRVR